MASATTPPVTPEIEIENFGPIIHANVELRPMTIFIGPSNTGKSYLATLLYALHRFWSRVGSPDRAVTDLLIRRFWDSSTRHIGDTGSTTGDPSELGHRVSEPTLTGHEEESDLSQTIVGMLRAEFDDWGVSLNKEILRCFGMDAANVLVRKGRNIDHARISIRHHPQQGAHFAELKLQIGDHIPTFSAIDPLDGSEMLDATLPDLLIDSAREFRNYSSVPNNRFIALIQVDLMARWMNAMAERFAGAFREPAFYFPADRTGLMHAHGSVVNAVLESAATTGFQPTVRTPLLSGVLTDFLRQLLHVDLDPKIRRSEINEKRLDAGEYIERYILRGSIGVERSALIDYPRFTYLPDDLKEHMPLVHASSMISDLAPIVLYLRHLVGPGNVLIIEEPESHLHPAMQVELTRQLAKLVQAGYRIVITTHSEWILEEMANIVRRSGLDPEERATKSASDAALPADQVGVWLFRPKRRPRGSEVVSVSVDENGMYPAGYDDVAIALHNDWANISDAAGAHE